MTGEVDPTLAAFESQVAALGQEHYELTLFVNGASGRSAHAIANVRAVCDTYLTGRFRLDIVDVHDHAELLIRHRILASPTLVKARPLPTRKLVGDLSDSNQLLAALDIQVVGGPNLA